VAESGVLPERYRSPERVARGGMGEVYRAEDTALDRLVAVKVLSDRYADDDGIRRRFTHEALAAARLSNVRTAVTIFDVGEHEGRPYIVMEYLAGGSLADRLAAQGAQPPGRVLAWLTQAAEALDAAHERGIVHRDVKPGNLLLDAEGSVRVADFGVASAAGLDSFTATGTVLGTAGYLAPEQARGEQTGPASDRYGLAVVAWELLTGARPFERESATAEAAAHVNAPVPPVSAANPELPRELDRVFAHALAKAPEDRFDSCAEFVAALREALDAAAGHTVVSAVPYAAAPRPAPTRGTTRPARNPLTYVLPALLALLLVGAALAITLADGDETPGTEGRTPPQTTQPPTTTAPETTTPATTETTAPATTEEAPATTEEAPPATTEEAPPATTEEAPPATTEEAPPSGDPVALNDEGFRLMQEGRFDEALPLLEQAVAAAQGAGTLTEAYASYNLAFTRKALGNCNGVLELLDRSEQVQGQRNEIDRLRREAERDCGGGGNGGG
jgi:tRNA A-37 threonylcarbamoyl transferase component Bud32